MKLVSWNVNGIRACLKKGFAESVANMDCDVICIQEVKCQEDTLPDLDLGYSCSYFNYAEKRGYSGTAIFSRTRPKCVSYDIPGHDSEGRLIVADSGGGRLLRLSTDGKRSEVLADRYNGKRFNSIYDVALDLAGNIFFTDPGGSDAENPNGAVYRYDIKTKKIALIDSGLAFPNGIVVTSDQKQLCISESKRYRLLIYDLTAQGTLANRRVLIDFPTKTSGKIIGGKFEPDGIVLDRAGRLYVGMWQGVVINVIEIPSGRILRQYSAGGEKAGNGCFYGEYFYIAVASKEAVFRLKLNVQGLP